MDKKSTEESIQSINKFFGEVYQYIVDSEASVKKTSEGHNGHEVKQATSGKK